MEIDLERTREYYRGNALCDCVCCRNLYAQIREVAPRLDAFLSELGIDAARPDEAASVEEENEIDYIFVSYTVCGKVLEHSGYEIDIKENGRFLSICVGDHFVPNGQKGEYFVVSVYGLRLPWVLSEPFPVPITLTKQGFWDKIKAFFSRKR